MAVHDALHNGHPKYLNHRFQFPAVKPAGQLWLFGEEGAHSVVTTVPLRALGKDGDFEIVRGLEREAKRPFPEAVLGFDVERTVRMPRP